MVLCSAQKCTFLYYLLSGRQITAVLFKLGDLCQISSVEDLADILSVPLLREDTLMLLCEVGGVAETSSQWCYVKFSKCQIYLCMWWYNSASCCANERINFHNVEINSAIDIFLSLSTNYQLGVTAASLASFSSSFQRAIGEDTCPN